MGILPACLRPGTLAPLGKELPGASTESGFIPARLQPGLATPASSLDPSMGQPLDDPELQSTLVLHSIAPIVGHRAASRRPLFSSSSMPERCVSLQD